MVDGSISALTEVCATQRWLETVCKLSVPHILNLNFFYDLDSNIYISGEKDLLSNKGERRWILIF